MPGINIPVDTPRLAGATLPRLGRSSACVVQLRYGRRLPGGFASARVEQLRAVLVEVELAPTPSRRYPAAPAAGTAPALVEGPPIRGA